MTWIKKKSLKIDFKMNRKIMFNYNIPKTEHKNREWKKLKIFIRTSSKMKEKPQKWSKMILWSVVNHLKP